MVVRNNAYTFYQNHFSKVLWKYVNSDSVPKVTKKGQETCGRGWQELRVKSESSQQTRGFLLSHGPLGTSWCAITRYIFQIQMFHPLIRECGAWRCRIQTLTSVFVIGRARYHYFHHSYCYRQSPESLLTLDNGLCNLQLDCRIRNKRKSPPGQTNKISLFSRLSNEFSSADLAWALLDSNLGDCSTMNGTLPLSAELKQNILFSVKLLRIVCSI